MEFLIIAIVIISIFSSITKQFKKNRKKEAPFDPWSFDSDSPEDDFKRLEEETEEEEDFIEEEKPVTEIPVKQKYLQDTYSRLQKDSNYDSPSYLETREQIKAPSFQGKKKEYKETKETGELETNLKELLLGNKLPLAIVASEVLGFPRAIRPYGRKRT